MAHLIDNSTGRPAIAYFGETPWHGLGATMTAGQSIDDWMRAAGLDWQALRSFVRYATGANQGEAEWQTDKENVVLFRSDTKARLGIVSADYKVVQPAQKLDLMSKLCDSHGYAMETAGAIKDGRVVWALAKSGKSVDLGGGDRIGDYVLCSTSFDGSQATRTMHTNIRVVCNNTLTIAQQDKKRGHSVSHRTRWSADAAVASLGLGNWQQHVDQCGAMTTKRIEPAQMSATLLQLYHGLSVAEFQTAQQAAKHDPAAASTVRSVTKTLTRVADIMDRAPGQDMATARGTAWGLLNAITFDVDHAKPARGQENRLASAWFGDGNALKSAAWAAAVEMVDGSATLDDLMGKRTMVPGADIGTVYSSAVN